MSGSRINNDMSIEDILASIRNVINNKGSNDFPEEDLELELVEVVNSEPEYDEMFSEDNSLLSEDSIVGTKTILENFVETARSLGHDINDVSFGDSQNKTMEAFLIDMLRPQMKQWLDENLQHIVKQVVADEIRRLVSNMSRK